MDRRIYYPTQLCQNSVNEQMINFAILCPPSSAIMRFLLRSALDASSSRHSIVGVLRVTIAMTSPRIILRIDVHQISFFGIVRYHNLLPVEKDRLFSNCEIGYYMALSPGSASSAMPGNLWPLRIKKNLSWKSNAWNGGLPTLFTDEIRSKGNSCWIFTLEGGPTREVESILVESFRGISLRTE